MENSNRKRAFEITITGNCDKMPELITRTVANLRQSKAPQLPQLPQLPHLPMRPLMKSQSTNMNNLPSFPSPSPIPVPVPVTAPMPAVSDREAAMRQMLWRLAAAGALNRDEKNRALKNLKALKNASVVPAPVPVVSDREVAMRKQLWRLAAAGALKDAQKDKALKNLKAARNAQPVPKVSATTGMQTDLMDEIVEPAAVVEPVVPDVQTQKQVDRDLFNRADRLARLKTSTNTNSFWDEFDPAWNSLRSQNGNTANLSSLYGLRTEIAIRLAAKLGKIFVNVFVNEHPPGGVPTAPPVPVGTTVNSVMVAGHEYKPFYTVTQGASVQASYNAAKMVKDRPSMGDILATVKAGGSALVFGLGSSGSGKSYCLFGAPPSTPGYMALLLSQLTDMGCEATLERVFELSGEIDADELVSNKPFTGPLSNLVKPEIRDFTAEVTKAPNSAQMLARVDALRKVARTVNNPRSSRGHVFFVWRVVNAKTGKAGVLTLVDMAGIEDATESLRQVIREMPLSTGQAKAHEDDRLYDVLRAVSALRRNKLLDKPPSKWATVPEVGPQVAAILTGRKAGKEVHPYTDVVTTVLQGLFIQQTLLDISFYFQQRANVEGAAKKYRMWDRNWTPKKTPKGYKMTYTRNSSIVNYADSTYMPQAAATFDDMFGIGFIKGKSRDPTRVISVMKTIEGLRSPGTEQTYCMLAVINPMLKFGALESMEDTLKYAQSVSV